MWVWPHAHHLLESTVAEVVTFFQEKTPRSLLCDHQAHPRPETEGHQLLCILTPPLGGHLELSPLPLMGHGWPCSVAVALGVN